MDLRTSLKVAFRRRFPRRQEVACSTCSTVLRERWRRPCPVCGDTRRLVARGMDIGSVAAHDTMG